MKVTWMTVAEIAAALKLSVVSIRRAYSKGDIPVVRIGRMVRFDLDHVRMVMQRKGEGLTVATTRTDLPHRATGGVSRRRGATSPRTVKRGRNFHDTPRRKQ
jgi:excisionase family DNA binding protein